jgi:hypothetical protein
MKSEKFEPPNWLGEEVTEDSRYKNQALAQNGAPQAEVRAREHACHTMRPQILTPRHWTHPSKEFLRQWYARIGYAPQTTEPFESMHPELVPELATECATLQEWSPSGLRAFAEIKF